MSSILNLSNKVERLKVREWSEAFLGSDRKGGGRVGVYLIARRHETVPGAK